MSRRCSMYSKYSLSGCNSLQRLHNGILLVLQITEIREVSFTSTVIFKQRPIQSEKNSDIDVGKSAFNM